VVLVDGQAGAVAQGDQVPVELRHVAARRDAGRQRPPLRRCPVEQGDRRAVHRAARALLPAKHQVGAAGLQGGGAEQVDLELRGGDGGGIAGAEEAHAVDPGIAERLIFEGFGGAARNAVALDAAEHVL